MQPLITQSLQQLLFLQLNNGSYNSLSMFPSACEVCRLPPCVIGLAWKQQWHCDVCVLNFSPVPRVPR